MYPYPIIFGLDLYEIMLIVAIVACFLLCDKMMTERKFSITLQKITILGAVVAIALGYGFAVLFQAFYNYLDNGVFEIASTTGATFYGGLLGGAAIFLLVWFVGGKFLLKKEKAGEQFRRFPDIANIAACCIPMAHGLGRIGCLFAGCCHGNPTNAWYGITMHTPEGVMKVVPIQLFEAIFLFALTAILIWLYFKNISWLPLLPIYCFVYGTWRFCIEFARGDERGATIIKALSPSQLIAILLIVVACAYALVFFLKRRKKEKHLE
jgi:phosphatidylglycerol:prolipoprotein diacylglycerol transferase